MLPPPAFCSRRGVSRAISGCSRQLLCWGRPEERELGKTIFEDIARDKEIVKMVLLLTGGFEGVKREGGGPLKYSVRIFEAEKEVERQKRERAKGLLQAVRLRVRNGGNVNANRKDAKAKVEGVVSCEVKYKEDKAKWQPCIETTHPLPAAGEENFQRLAEKPKLRSRHDLAASKLAM